ncbi:MAG: glycosyltransferase [Pseudomonadota bacterium]
MRVLYVINGFNQGGAEHGLLTLLENGFFEGHDLRVLALCRGHGGLAETVGKAAGAGRLRLAHDSEALTMGSMLKGAFALAGEMRRHRPDLVVLSLKQANIVGRFVLCFFPKARCVSFEHIMRYRSRRLQWVYQYLLWLLSFRVGEVWGDCRDTIDETKRYFMPIRQRRSQVVPLFCVQEGTQSKSDYGLAQPLRMAVAGRLSPVKNIDKLIGAVRRLIDSGTPVVLDVFGDGPEYANLEKTIKDLGLDDSVTLLGFRQAWFTDGPSYDIYVNASDTEGFCIVVAEAMAVGLPVITTDVGGIRDYGRDGVNMMKFAVPDEASIVEHVEALTKDEALRRKIGTQAATDMAENYSAAALRTAGSRVLEALPGTADTGT